YFLVVFSSVFFSLSPCFPAAFQTFLRTSASFSKRLQRCEFLFDLASENFTFLNLFYSPLISKNNASFPKAVTNVHRKSASNQDIFSNN
ncbi:hypothetical protein ACFFGT_24380, partial [Mucilaginibacter angelicae]